MPARKNTHIAVLAAIAALLFIPGSLGRSELNTAGLSPETRQKAVFIYDLLKRAGLKGLALRLAMIQVAFETGLFRSKVMQQNNNFSGIMWINKPAVQKNAVKGLPFPKKEGKYFYANFKSPIDWANDYLRLLKKGSDPLKAVSVSDYVKRLAANKYFYPNYGTNYNNYLAGLNYYFKKFFV